jgi:hypothetical protein
MTTPTKIYTVNRREASFFLAILALAWGYAIWAHPGPLDIFPVVFLSVLFVAIAVGFLWGTYARNDLKKGIFTRVDYFLFRKQLNYDEIKELRYNPTWKAGSVNRSLYIIGTQDGHQKTINFPNLGFSPKTIAAIAHDLKKAIPVLKTDDYTEALIKKYEGG